MNPPRKNPTIDLKLLELLTLTPGISGREEEVGALIRKEIQPYCDGVQTDALGNVMGRRKGNKPSLLLEAHMDEVGFMASHLDESGFVRFMPVGPILEPLLPGQRLCLHTDRGAFQGVVGYGQDCGSGLTFEDLYLDTGFDEEELRSIMKTGDAITFIGGITCLGGDLIASKALDNRVGVLALLEVARSMADLKLDREVIFGFSVRHEVGALGIPALVAATQPHQAIVLDVALASDYPHQVSGRIGRTDLNAGPVLWRGIDLSDPMVVAIEKAATQNKIQVQRAAWNRFTPTNASHVMHVGPAVQTALISIPHRYPHGPNGVVATQDIGALIELLKALLIGPELAQSHAAPPSME